MSSNQAWTQEQSQKIHDALLAVYHNRSAFPDVTSYWNAIKDVLNAHAISKASVIAQNNVNNVGQISSTKDLANAITSNDKNNFVGNKQFDGSVKASKK